LATKEAKSENVNNEFHLSQLASVGQIAAGIAHEVKNPLTAVKGFLQLLKENHVEEYVDIAQSELNNAISTLENLLHVSKPDLEDEPFQSVSMSSELELMFHLFQDQMYRVHIIKNFSDTDAKVYGKRNQLKKALFNLFKNAFEAIADKGTIKVEHYVQDQFIVISIEDTGIGIPQEKLKMLGTPFYTTKMQGTGMGLTQVFSVIYQHAGSIHVHSEENVGTRFVIMLPRESEQAGTGVTELPLNYTEGQNLKEFFWDNKNDFEKALLAHAVNVEGKIEEIQRVGNIDLLANAHRLVLYIVEGREHEMISFAKAEGIAWAKYSLTIAFKLEWVQAIRRVLWDFLYNYDRLCGRTEDSFDRFYMQEKKINQLVDQFLTYFFISYTDYKDLVLQKQRELVEDLSVPIIPLTEKTCIVPLIGNIDAYRVNTIEDKVIFHVGTLRIENLIFDMSSVVEIETEAISHFMRILDGLGMMGCKPVLTGMRPEVVKQIIRLDLPFEKKADTKGSLQQALDEFLGR